MRCRLLGLAFAVSAYLIALPNLASAQGTVPDPLLIQLKHYGAAYDQFLAGDMDGAIDSLHLLKLEYANDANFHYLLGLLLAKKARYIEAIEAFEHTVLIDPSNAGAWLDLGLAYKQAKQFVSAKSMFDYVESEFKPSPAIRDVIAASRRQIELAIHNEKKWRGTLEFALGRDSNANSGILASIIPVTFGSTTIDLPLDASYKPRADSFLTGLAEIRYQNVLGRDVIEVSGFARDQSFRKEHTFSSAQVSINATWRRVTAWGVGSLSGTTEYYSLGGTSLLSNSHVGGTWEQGWKSCRVGGGLESEWRRYYTLTNLHANMNWAQIASSCDLALAAKPLQVSFLARAGLDQPLNNRAGGETRRRDLALQFAYQWHAKVRSDMTIASSNAVDQEGYSPLLESNAHRRLKRSTLRFQFIISVLPNIDLQLRAEKSRVNSNILLFSQESQSYNAGLQYRF